MLLTGNRLQAVPLVVALLFLLLPASKVPQRFPGALFTWPWRIFFIASSLAAFAWLGSFNTFISAIYKSPAIKQEFQRMYAEKMRSWPVPYQDVFIDTDYGKVHVIVSGKLTAPPLVLLHVSGVASWSWQYNIKALSKTFRTYAIDTIGDAGKSELNSRDHYPQDGKTQAELYSQIFDKLGLKSAYLVGGSEGGFIATNIALYSPDRVKKLALLGPMGFGGTTESVIRIVLIQFFPLDFIQENTVRWAFGNKPKLINTAGTWFRLVMSGTFPRKARPTQFKTGELKRIRVPVLFVLGEKDNLLGKPEDTIKLAQNIPNVEFKVLNTGHFIAMEQPEQVDKLLIAFFN